MASSGLSEVAVVIGRFAYQLPAALGGGHLTEEIPEEQPLRQWCFPAEFHVIKQTEALERVSAVRSWKIDTCSLENRREKVKVDRIGVRNYTAGNHPRPTHDSGNANATFIGLTLSASQRSVVPREFVDQGANASSPSSLNVFLSDDLSMTNSP